MICMGCGKKVGDGALQRLAHANSCIANSKPKSKPLNVTVKEVENMVLGEAEVRKDINKPNDHFGSEG